jgi:hypothetical protein
VRNPGPVAAVGLLFAVAVAAGPQVYSRRIERRFSAVPGNRAVVLHRYGDVDVIGTADSRVLVEAFARVTAASRQQALDYLGRIDVRAEDRGESLLIVSVCPRADNTDSQFGYDVRLVVSLPRAARLSVVNSFGDVHVAGMAGACRVANRYGDVEVDRAGACTVSNAHGRVRLNDVNGTASVVNTYGDVVLEDVAGRIRVDNSYGVVRTDRVDGEMLIVNRFGNVVAHPQGGRLAIDNRYGDVQTWVEGTDLAALSILSRMGNVRLSLRDGVPFFLGANALQGRIVSGLPFPVNSTGTQQVHHARHGRGGPSIQLRGIMTDFTIRADTPRVTPVVSSERGQK